MRFSSLLATCFFTFSSLSAQQFVDVFPDKMYFWINNKNIFEVDTGLHIKSFSVDLPESVKFTDKMRPKIRFDRLWVGDGKKIWSKSLDASIDNKWELMKLPNEVSEVAGMAEFEDFEILSDKEAIICGAIWYATNFDSLRRDIHFVFDYKTGTIKKTIESFDVELVLEAMRMGEITSDAFFNIEKIKSSYLCRFDTNILIVGKYSGSVTVFDTKTGRTRKFEVIPEGDLPSNPKAVVNYIPAIAWIGPLSGDDVLICCRMWTPLAGYSSESDIHPNNFDHPSRGVSVYVFRTLNLKSGKIILHGPEYLQKQADWRKTLFEDSGQLMSLSDFIENISKSPVQPKNIERTEPDVGMSVSKPGRTEN